MMKMSSLWNGRHIVPVLLVALFLGGCGSKVDDLPLGEVEGTLKYNGKPQAGVLVAFIFEVEGVPPQRSTGITDADGHYVLKTDRGPMGVVVGSNRVLLSVSHRGERAKKGEEAGGNADSPGERIPDKYGEPASTMIRKEVKEGKQVIDLIVN
jgi:hypothetical protein